MHEKVEHAWTCEQAWRTRYAKRMIYWSRPEILSIFIANHLSFNAQLFEIVEQIWVYKIRTEIAITLCTSAYSCFVTSCEQTGEHVFLQKS